MRALRDYFVQFVIRGARCYSENGIREAFKVHDVNNCDEIVVTMKVKFIMTFRDCIHRKILNNFNKERFKNGNANYLQLKKKKEKLFVSLLIEERPVLIQHVLQHYGLI
jgi:hypothetical protein